MGVAVVFLAVVVIALGVAVVFLAVMFIAFAVVVVFRCIVLRRLVTLGAYAISRCPQCLAVGFMTITADDARLMHLALYK